MSKDSVDILSRLLAIAFLCAVGPWLITMCWNGHLAPFFSAPLITYKQAFAVYLLIKVLK